MIRKEGDNYDVFTIIYSYSNFNSWINNNK